ncbi:MAG: flagellar basal body-associated FliL family protein [Chromatiales bacterium]
MADAKKPEQVEESAKRGSRKKLITIVAASVALLGAAGGGTFYPHKQKDAAAHATGGEHGGHLPPRTQVLAEIHKILQKTIGSKGVKKIYFTSFVMQ